MSSIFSPLLLSYETSEITIIDNYPSCTIEHMQPFKIRFCYINSYGCFEGYLCSLMHLCMFDNWIFFSNFLISLKSRQLIPVQSVVMTKVNVNEKCDHTCVGCRFSHCHIYRKTNNFVPDLFIRGEGYFKNCLTFNCIYSKL